MNRIWTDERGSSSVELALVAGTILVLLLLGASETGARIWTKLQLDNAVRVGIEFVMIHGDSKPADVESVTQTATLLDAVSVAPAGGGSYSYCGCASSSGVHAQSCGTSCGDGTSAGTYAGIQASVSRVPLFHGCRGLVPERSARRLVQRR
jgi:Flp pilus assembly pilin Flp